MRQLEEAEQLAVEQEDFESAANLSSELDSLRSAVHMHTSGMTACIAALRHWHDCFTLHSIILLHHLSASSCCIMLLHHHYCVIHNKANILCPCTQNSGVPCHFDLVSSATV